jgi:hypothetical protein
MGSLTDGAGLAHFDRPAHRSFVPLSTLQMWSFSLTRRSAD